MGNLLQKLGWKKKKSSLEEEKSLFKDLLEEITLTDEDLVYLNRRVDILLLIRKDRFYSIGKFSKIDPSDQKVSAMYLGKTKGSSILKFQPYKELRNSL